MFQLLLTTLLWLVLAPAGGGGSNVESLSVHTPTPVPQDVPSDTKIILVRTNCYGGCPVYSLTILADGRVLYHGSENVKKEGEIQSHISREKLRDLIAAFKKINYFDLADGYVSRGKDCPNWGTDMPFAITSLTLAGKTKEVKHYYGCSGSVVLGKITWIEETIDDAVNVKQWME